jgi:hypothetical protein
MPSKLHTRRFGKNRPLNSLWHFTVHREHAHNNSAVATRTRLAIRYLQRISYTVRWGIFASPARKQSQRLETTKLDNLITEPLSSNVHLCDFSLIALFRLSGVMPHDTKLKLNSYGRILGFLDWSLYFFFQVAPQLYSRGRVDPVPDPLLLRKSSSAGNRTWTSGSVARNSDL